MLGLKAYAATTAQLAVAFKKNYEGPQMVWDPSPELPTFFFSHFISQADFFPFFSLSFLDRDLICSLEVTWNLVYRQVWP